MSVFALQESVRREDKTWTKTLILAGFATTLGLSLPVGYNIGVVNSPADVSTRGVFETKVKRFLVLKFRERVSSLMLFCFRRVLCVAVCIVFVVMRLLGF